MQLDLFTTKLQKKIKTLNSKQVLKNKLTRTIKVNPFSNTCLSKIAKKTVRTSKFKLPPIQYLVKASAKNNNLKDIENNKSPQFLEKILLDFDVEGKIKKISHGPVVTLYEFEPAPGIKVSKIINLSEDIARNTSSESTRIATIPGKNTVGIEIPNHTRENVCLSEIISDSGFVKRDIKLPIALGKGISGIPIIGDLAIYATLINCWYYWIG